MLLHDLAERAGEGLALVKVGHVGRRRRRRRAEELFENPLAAFHRRGACWVRCERENAGLSEQAAAIAWRLDFSELRAVDAVDAVMPGEAGVDIGEIGVDEVENAAVFA